MSGSRDRELRARVAADPSDTDARFELACRMLLLAVNVAELTWRDDGGEHSGTDVVEATVTEAFSHLSAATITRLLDAATGPVMSDMVTEITGVISKMSVSARRDRRSDTRPTPQPIAAPAHRRGAEAGGHDSASPADEGLTVSHGPADLEGSSVAECEFERPSISLADVAGLENVKQMINVRLLAPVRSPDKAARFGRLPSGGLLMWGAPGCGKTFIARALAGSLDVDIYAVGLDEVLSKWLGQSERHLASVFAAARRRSPCVLFFDEVDVLGGRRSRLDNSGLRGVVSQFLTESDGATKDNTGVFMIGATNLPWEVDPAMRRPGRFDRTLFVPPPDFDARLAILAGKLAGVPLGTDLNVPRIARMTDARSGADVAHVAESAIDAAFTESLTSDRDVVVTQQHLERAVTTTNSSIEDWVTMAVTAGEASNDREMWEPFFGWYENRHKRSW